MNGLLPLAFGAPAALLALLALPAIWWLLRLTPPKPVVRDFPPTAMLRDLVPPDETPAHTPWWILFLRLALAALVILALAAPVWRPSLDDDGRDGPLWLIVDSGWPAATDWEAVRTDIESRLDRAARRGRPVVLVASTDGADQPFEPVSPEEAKRRLATLAPRPRADARLDLLAGLGASAERRPPGSVVWLTHGVDLAAPADGRRFAEALAKIAAGTPVVVAPPARLATRAVEAVDNGL
ncbi:MAG: BatA domain-containing protein, partial [Siculibacillus sp.]|nr:BatA domain-containing protein [Siculibacillus sp.]